MTSEITIEDRRLLSKIEGERYNEKHDRLEHYRYYEMTVDAFFPGEKSYQGPAECVVAFLDIDDVEDFVQELVREVEQLKDEAKKLPPVRVE